uniref:Glutamyl-tRNA synthetase n=2 Tax=Palpitomonas bilix TaxID=652834 RepID=A0A7S3GED6_9EUKA|mmetsp:Transcript_45675/g.118030  ORF Transcript_45675/g.118030 Transcript_45675/m.118030 type:complete len:303 (+) Transcript_45675:961-1869(+)
MGISHVLRGEEWLSSAPKHMLLFKALDWAPPVFAHLPLLLNVDRAKLSKRQQHASVSYYVDRGFLPEAVINFVSLLGWNPKTTKEIFNLNELVNEFSLGNVQKGGAVVDESRMMWMNREHLRRRVPENLGIITDEYAEIIFAVQNAAKATIPSLSGAMVNEKRLAKLIPAVVEHVDVAAEIGTNFPFLFSDPDLSSDAASTFLSSFWGTPSTMILSNLIKGLSEIKEADWNPPTIKKELKKSLKVGQKVPFRSALQLLRLAVTGTSIGPSIIDIVCALERDIVLSRLKTLEFFVQEKSDETR